MKISVAMCTYNGSLFVEKQLDSIINQTVAVHEIIICDDDSSDGTIAIIKSYQNIYPNLIYLFQNNSGLGTIKNFEKAISNATGDLIFLSDQDDIWYFDKVEKSCQFFADNYNCILLFSNGDLINDNDIKTGSTLWDQWGFNTAIRSAWLNNKLAFDFMVKGNNKITGATICFKKSLKDKILPIRLPLGYWHDSWLGTHAAALNGLFFFEQSLIQYRVHNNQQVGISNEGLATITLNANKEFISKNEYFNRLKKMYPHLKKCIAAHEEKGYLKKLILKFKRKLNLFKN
jgi:glycosyltransferase involved in cell wall biosynthesis